MAKIALYYLRGGWEGVALLASDSTAALSANLTQSPRNGTLLLLPFRAALVQLRARVQEVWLPAQHDSGSHTLLATLNAEADRLADEGAKGARAFTVPWLPLFPGRVLATHHGRLILDPRKSAAAIAHQHNTAKYIKHFPPPDPEWSSTLLIDAIDNAALEPRAVHTTMPHRLLAAQLHPPGYGGVLCPYCHLASPDITVHLLRRCPPFFLQYLSLSWRLLRHPQVFPLLSASAGSSTLHQGAILDTPTLRVGLTWGVLPSPPHPDPSLPPHQVLLNLDGSWKVVSDDPRRPPLVHAQRTALAADHHAALAQHPPPLAPSTRGSPHPMDPRPFPASRARPRPP